MKHMRTVTLAVAMLLLAGCGGGSSSSGPTAATTTPAVWNQTDVVDALGLQDDGAGSWTFTDGLTDCPVAVIMTTAAQVSMYADAGDTVATNPDKTAGVKIAAEQTKTCQDAATKMLAKMK